MIRSVSSATGMNSAGDFIPRPGWGQRMRASNAITSLLLTETIGVIKHRKLLAGDCGAQPELQPAARFNSGIHFRFKEAASSPPVGFGAVQGHIGALQKRVRRGCIARTNGDADTCSYDCLATAEFIRRVQSFGH